MTDLKVLGHTPPDTDSTCSPILYAWYLNDVKGVPAKAFIGAEPNREAKFVLEKLNIATPEILNSIDKDDKLVILDTNNPEELIDGAIDAEIVEIIDHHKLFGLKTDGPIKMTIRTYGSVPTVIWEVMGEDVNKITPEMATLMLAPILSDTLNFTSSTTTEKDREVAAKLAEIAGIDMDEFAQEMFAAKSNLDGMNIREILLSDAKNFDFGGQKYKIAVLETTDPSQAIGMQQQLVKEIAAVKEEESLADMFFFVVDIINSNATLLSVSDSTDAIAKKVFGREFEDGKMLLEGVTSRKKQIAPKFAEVLE